MFCKYKKNNSSLKRKGTYKNMLQVKLCLTFTCAVFNLGRIFASLMQNILFWHKIKLLWSHTDMKKNSLVLLQLTPDNLNPHLLESRGNSNQNRFPLEKRLKNKFQCSAYNWFMLRSPTLCFHFFFHFKLKTKANFISCAKDTGSWVVWAFLSPFSENWSIIF